MENKWEVKSHSYQIGDTGDYDGFWEITDGKINICTKDDGDDIDIILKEVADLLNKTEINFYIDNPKEIDLHFECEGLKIQLSELQAKCDRYEAALRDIAKQHKIDEMDANDCDGDISEGYDAIVGIARKVLSAGEGDIVPKRYSSDQMISFASWCLKENDTEGGVANSEMSERDLKQWEDKQ